MQSRLVIFSACLMLIFISNEISFSSAGVLPDWREKPMIFPCGSSTNVNRGAGGAMIFNCREQTGTGRQGTGAGGGASGTSQVDTNVDKNGMVFVPSATRPSVQRNQQQRIQSSETVARRPTAGVQQQQQQRIESSETVGRRPSAGVPQQAEPTEEEQL